MIEGKICSRCGESAYRKSGHQNLCEKHYRFGQMRADAKRAGKYVPSHEELHSIANQYNRCADCDIEMNWLARENQTRVATLQHYRNGSLGIVCRSCNTRHAFTPDDIFRDIKKDHKFCPKCKEIKPDVDFCSDNGRSGPRKLKSHCRKCSGNSHRDWRIRNHEYYNRKQREWRARKRVESST